MQGLLSESWEPRRKLADNVSDLAKFDAREALDSVVRLLEAVGSPTSLVQKLNNVALFVERLSPRTRCSILLVDAEHGTLNIGAAPHLPEAYNAAIHGTCFGEGVGSCGTAAARRAPVIVADIEHSPLWINYRDLAREHGLAACWSTPVLDGSGELLGTFAMYYDQPREPTATDLEVLKIAGPLAAVVIRRQHDSDRLRESEERFRSAFDFAAIGKAMIGLDGRWLRVNQAMQRIVGYSADELLQMDFQSVTHPDDLDTDLAFVKEMLDGTRLYYQMEKRYVHRSGQVVWVLLSVSMVRDDAGNPRYFISQIQDISDRKRLQQQLNELTSSEQRRLGQDLHDGLGQELTGLSLLATAFATRATRAGSELADDALALAKLAQNAVATCKDIVRGVSPLTESQGGLVRGLKELAHRSNALGGKIVRFQAFEYADVTLSWDARNQLYRITQEAINNAIQHANASMVHVIVTAAPKNFCVEVVDDGDGISPEALGKSGSGLSAMRYRADALNATLTVQALPRGGTLVRCECPQPMTERPPQQ
jgi:PAS domain S-box-containing protein